MSFWTSSKGEIISGDASKAFVPEFTIIPNGTAALAKIKLFEIIEKAATQYAEAQKLIQITWEITSGDYKGRTVTQKIKPFDGKPDQIDRNLQMLRLIMTLCNYAPTHNNEPTNQDLKQMIGRICGIKIREWSMPKQDGSGMMEGNFVSEVHSATDFVSESGVKVEHVHSMPSDSALSRHSRVMDTLDSDLPF